MFYTIVHSPDFQLDCFRCKRPLAHAVQFVQNGRLITVGRECAKHYGVIWTAKIGPAANDPKVFAQAVEIWRQKHADRPRYRWPGGWEACQPVKEALGTLAWKRAGLKARR